MKPILFNTEMVRAILDGRKTVTRRVIKTKHKDACGFYVTTRKSDGAFMGVYEYDENEGTWDNPLKPPYEVNDILYVRETWGTYNRNWWEADYFLYRADYPDGATTYEHNTGVMCDLPNWRPSIHMPADAARIFLKVTGVRVERLQEITEEQAKAEGVIRLYDDLPDAEYTDWTKRIGLYPKSKEEWGYKNYLWHGNFGKYGSGNWQSDLWEYQYSGYDKAVGSFFSLWNSLLKKDQLQYYGFSANPYVWVIEFEVIDKAALQKLQGTVGVMMVNKLVKEGKA